MPSALEVAGIRDEDQAIALRERQVGPGGEHMLAADHGDDREALGLELGGAFRDRLADVRAVGPKNTDREPSHARKIHGFSRAKERNELVGTLL
jgi:hypothetical protein